LSAKCKWVACGGDSAEKVRQAFKNRQIEAHETLVQLDEIANVCVEAEEERQKLDVDENTFANQFLSLQDA